MMNQNQNPTFRKSNGTVVGQLKDGWLEKAVNPAIHKLHSPSGWATDKSHVDKLIQLQAKGIRLRLVTGVMLQATLKDLIEHGFKMNRGHGDQWVLVDQHWDEPYKAQQLSML
jgi:hypothetical protein